MSFAPRFSITNRITAALTRVERARGFLDAAKLSEEWLAAMRSRALLLEAHHTTHIEGTRLTLEQAEQLLAGRAVPDADPDDARELLNYREAFEFVGAWLDDSGMSFDEAVTTSCDTLRHDAATLAGNSEVNLQQTRDTTCDKLTTGLAS